MQVNNMKKAIMLMAIILSISLFFCISFARALTEISIIDNSSNFVGTWSSVALDTNGFAHIIEREGKYNQAGYWRYCNNTLGSWTCKNILERNGSYAWGSDIAIDSSGHIFIAVNHGSSGGGTGIAICNDTATPYSFFCYDVYAGGSRPSIDIDTNNMVHIAIIATDGSVVYGNNIAGFFNISNLFPAANNPSILSLKVDKFNTVHFAFDGNSWGARYAECSEPCTSDKLWGSTPILLNNTGALTNGVTSLDLHGKIPHISTALQSGELLECNNETGTGFKCDVVDSNASLITGWTSMMVDRIGVRHILYEDKTTNDIKYANNTNGVWTNAIVDHAATYEEDGNLNTPFGLVSKRGRISDSISYSTNITAAYFLSYQSDYGELKSAVFSFGNYSSSGCAWYNEILSLWQNVSVGYLYCVGTTLWQCQDDDTFHAVGSCEITTTSSTTTSTISPPSTSTTTTTIPSVVYPKCQMCDPDAMPKTHLIYWLFAGVCLFINLVLCSTVIVALLFVFLIGLWAYAKIKRFKL